MKVEIVYLLRHGCCVPIPTFCEHFATLILKCYVLVDFMHFEKVKSNSMALA